MTIPCSQEGRIERIEEKMSGIPRLEEIMKRVENHVVKTNGRVRTMEKIMWFGGGIWVSLSFLWKNGFIGTLLAKLIE